MSEYVKFKLKPEYVKIQEQVQGYFDDYTRMLNIGRAYNAEFTEAGYEGVQAIYTTDYTGAFHALQGFKKPHDHEHQIEKRIEIRHDNLNTFKPNHDFQPLKKNKFNKERTNNFEWLKVSYIPVVNAVYGNNDTYKIIGEDDNREILIKSFGYSMVEGVFNISVLEEDVNDYIREHYEQVSV